MANDELIRKHDAIDAVLDRMDVEKHGRNAKPEEVVWALENLPPVQMEDAISRQAAIYIASGYCHPSNIAKELAKLPSVNSDLIQKIEVGIKATTPTDEYMVGMRNGMKWCKSLLDGKEPEYDTVQPNHNAEPSKMVDDTISRQAAIDALDCINGVEEVLRSLPSAQPTNEMLERCKFEYIHACKIVSIPTPDVTGRDKQDAYAVIKALQPIFGDVPFAKVSRG